MKVRHRDQERRWSKRDLPSPAISDFTAAVERDPFLVTTRLRRHLRYGVHRYHRGEEAVITQQVSVDHLAAKAASTNDVWGAV